MTSTTQPLVAPGGCAANVALLAGLLFVLGGIGWCVYTAGFENGVREGRFESGEEYMDGKICYSTRQP